jgi:hypothetical protein
MPTITPVAIASEFPGTDELLLETIGEMVMPTVVATVVKTKAAGFPRQPLPNTYY